MARFSTLNEHFTINNIQHNRGMRNASYNSICRYYKHETEGGHSFAVSATRLWKNVPLYARKSDSVKSLKAHLFIYFYELTFISSIYIYILQKLLILLQFNYSLLSQF